MLNRKHNLTVLLDSDQHLVEIKIWLHHIEMELCRRLANTKESGTDLASILTMKHKVVGDSRRYGVTLKLTSRIGEISFINSRLAADWLIEQARQGLQGWI